MKKLLLLLFLFSGTSSFAQYISLDFFRNPSQRTLLFALPEKDDEWLMTNEDLTGIIKEYWTATTDHKFMSIKEAKELAKSDKDKYALVLFVLNGVNEINLTRNPEESHNSGLNIEYYCGGSVCFGGYLYSRGDATKSELINIIMMAQFLYQNCNKIKKQLKMMEESAAMFGQEIKTKTLLVNKDDLRATEAEVLANYPYPLKFVEQSIIDKAIIEKSTEFLIIHKGADDYNYEKHIMLNPSTGAIISYNDATYATAGVKEKKDGMAGKDFATFIKNAGIK